MYERGVVLSPSELDTLQRVFDHLCRHERIDTHSIRAERVASLLVHYFQAGCATEADLMMAYLNHEDLRKAS